MSQAVTEEGFPLYVSTISKQQWNELFELIPEIENTTDFFILDGLKLSNDKEFLSPYYIPAEVVRKFSKTVEKLNLVIPFDWPQWEEGSKILNDRSVDFNKFDITKLCKLIVFILRNDVLNDGFLLMNLSDGTIVKILQGIRGNVE